MVRSTLFGTDCAGERERTWESSDLLLLFSFVSLVFLLFSTLQVFPVTFVLYTGGSICFRFRCIARRIGPSSSKLDLLPGNVKLDSVGSLMFSSMLKYDSFSFLKTSLSRSFRQLWCSTFCGNCHPREFRRNITLSVSQCTSLLL